MLENQVYVFITAIIFGFAADMADLLDEHGLKWFKHADLLFGILWGAAGVVMMLLYPPTAIFLVGVVLYWIIVGKIDYLNHQIASVMILSWGSWEMYRQILNSFHVLIYTAICLLMYAVFYKIKKHYKLTSIFRIRQVVPALIISIILGNYVILVINIITLIGWQISDFWFNWFEKHQDSTFFKKIGVYIHNT